MSFYITDKQRITRRILEILDEYSEENQQRAMRAWWVNLRSNGGLGLTLMGDQYFTRAEIEYTSVPIGKLKSSVLDFCLRLDQKLRCPYFVNWYKEHRCIKVYDGRVAVMINLHGTLDGYLNTISRKEM